MIQLRKRGHTCHADFMIGRKHVVRGTLGTRREDVALRLVHRLEIAIAEGPNSTVWSEIAKVLPQATYCRFADHVGVREKFVATWAELRKTYEATLDQWLAINRLSENTVINYKRVLREFDVFLNDQTPPISLLSQIDKAAADNFKFWRISKIQVRRGKGGGAGYTVDSAVMHRMFDFGIERGLVQDNPFICEANHGSAERGSQPYEPNELVALRRAVAAAGERLLFLVLRWTGLRKSDAVTLTWSECDLDKKVIRKLTKKSQYLKSAIIEMKEELYDTLKAEFDSRRPQPDDTVLCLKSGKSLTTSDLDYRIKKWGKSAEVKTHSHRFRDTFAVDMLLHNIQPPIVARMLADTEATVKKCYLPYVMALRQQTKGKLDSGTMLEDFISGTPASQSKETAVDVTADSLPISNVNLPQLPPLSLS